jgi:hypothetical protein
MRERRQVPRYLADISAVISQPGGGPTSHVTVVVLSVQGCCIQGVGAPEVGRKCLVTLEWQAEEIQAEAVVAWKDAKGRAGLRFLPMDQQSSETLRELCATLRLQPMSTLPPEK